MNPSRSGLTRYRKTYRGYKVLLSATLLILLVIPLLEGSWTVVNKKHTLSQLVTAVATRQGLCPKLVGSMVQVESSGMPSAVSSASAVGLMQIHYPTWKHKWTRAELKIPEVNLLAGTEILKGYMKESRTLDEALRKYSGGARDYAKKVKKGMRG